MDDVVRTNIPVMQQQAYCRNCDKYIRRDDMTQTWTATDEPGCPHCFNPIPPKYLP